MSPLYAIVDTPGFFDSSLSAGDIEAVLAKLSEVAGDRVEALVFVVPYGRFSEPQVRAYRLFRSTFGDEVLRYTVLAFTQCGARTEPDVKKELPDIWDSYFKFCFVRNPWDRIISHYFSSSQGDWHGKTYDYAKIPFDDFVETHVLSEVGCLMCKKQSVWYTGLDYIGRFENYEDSIHTIFRKIGINQEPEIFKVNTTNHKSYREYYNDRTAIMVYEKFKDEIEYLGYEYED